MIVCANVYSTICHADQAGRKKGDQWRHGPVTWPGSAARSRRRRRRWVIDAVPLYVRQFVSSAHWDSLLAAVSAQLPASRRLPVRVRGVLQREGHDQSTDRSTRSATRTSPNHRVIAGIGLFFILIYANMQMYARMTDPGGVTLQVGRTVLSAVA